MDKKRVEEAVLQLLKTSKKVSPGDVRVALEREGIKGGEIRNAVARLMGRGKIQIDADMHVSVVS